MRKEDILLTKEQMKKAYTSNIQGAFKFRNLANSASLKTAKTIRDLLNKYISVETNWSPNKIVLNIPCEEWSNFNKIIEELENENR